MSATEMKHRLLCLIFVCLCVIMQGQVEFVQNKGQWPSIAAAGCVLPNGFLWLENDGFTYNLIDPEAHNALHPSRKTRPEMLRTHAFKTHFTNALVPIVAPLKPRKTYYNYYLGHDPSKWSSHCAAFEQIRYHQLYPMTDLLVYSANGTIKYDFILHPGADVANIGLAYEGVERISIVDEKVVLHTSVGDVIESKPFAYQLIDGRIIEIPCTYRLEQATVGYELSNYNPAYDVIIDPEIVFSTFIGSSSNNFGFTAADDSQSNLISGAAVFGNNYPTTLGAYSTSFNSGSGNYIDVAISKFSPDGSDLIYSTYLGGSRIETPHSIVCDDWDNFFVMGATGSSNFPTTANAYDSSFEGGPALDMSNFFTSSHPDGCDFFISKFTSNGELDASTYIGGSGNDGLNTGDQLYYNYGDIFRGEINVDDANNIYVASLTLSSDFPTSSFGLQTTYGGGACDGIVFKMDNNLENLMWSNYIGGSATEACYALEFNGTDEIIVAGGTKSNNFPHAANGVDNSFGGQTDGFVLRISTLTYALVAGTFFGTSEYDQIYFVQTDLDNNVYVCGQTAGEIDITPGCYGQPNSGQFIVKYNPTLTALVWATTIGTGSGEIDISPTAFLVSDCNQIYMSGWGGETNHYCGSFYSCYAEFSTTNGLPITNDAFQSTTDGSDFYLCVLDADATTLDYATFLGGSLSSEHVDGGTSRFNKNGTVFQAVCAGCQSYDDFPSTPGAWSSTNPSSGCNLAVFRFDLGILNAEMDITAPDIICTGTPIQFNNYSNGADQYLWDFGDDSSSTLFEPEHAFAIAGTYTVTLISSTINDCLQPDTAQITIQVLEGVEPAIDPVEPVCIGQEIQLQGYGSDNLFWLPNPALSATNVANPIVTVGEATTFTLVDFNACESDSVDISIVLYIPETDISPLQTICVGQSVQLEASGGATYEWSPGSSLNDFTSATPLASPTETTTYIVAITTAENCTVEESVGVNVVDDFPGGNVYDDLTVCYGNTVYINAIDGWTYNWYPAATLTNSQIANPGASPLQTTTYYVDITNICGEGTDQVTVHVVKPDVIASPGGTICAGNGWEAYATGALTYTWQPITFASPAFEAQTTLSPLISTLFTVTGVDENNCAAVDSVYVQVLESPMVDAGPDQYFDYPGEVPLFGNNFGLLYHWYPAEGLSCTDCLYPMASPSQPTIYHLVVTDGNGCSAEDDVFVKPFAPLYVPNTVTPNNDGINDVFFAVTDYAEGFSLRIFDRWGNKVFESKDPQEVWVPSVKGTHFVQNDVYLWVIQYNTPEGTNELTGHVSVVR
jgi:gliding motility-associated-like protein